MAIIYHGTGRAGELEFRRYKEQQKRTPKKCPACKSGDVTVKAGVFSCGKCGYVNKPTPEIIAIDEVPELFKKRTQSDLSENLAEIHLSMRNRQKVEL